VTVTFADLPVGRITLDATLKTSAGQFLNDARKLIVLLVKINYLCGHPSIRAPGKAQTSFATDLAILPR